MPRHPLRPAVLCLLLLAACGGGEPAVDPAAGDAAEPNRIENEALGIAVVDPADAMFELESNEGDEIRLRFAGDEEFAPGTVVYRAEPEQDYGVNLVEAVNAREEEMEAMPGGEFLGQVELGSEHLGSLYSTRGRYTGEDGQTVEEIRIFAVHPTANRLLHMTYSYPPAPGQTEARLLDQAAVAFGYVEPLPAAEVAAEEDAAESTAAEVETPAP